MSFCSITSIESILLAAQMDRGSAFQRRGALGSNGGGGGGGGEGGALKMKWAQWHGGICMSAAGH